MSLSIGIVGLPNVGKSTLFNALTRQSAPAANYPFCTIDPSVGLVKVPDERLNQLTQLSNSQDTIPAIVEFVDIAGLVKGASEGQGLGNQFLSHIKEVDAILEVVRIFEDDDIIHVHGKVDPLGDIEVINLELALADLQVVTKRLSNIERDVRAGNKDAKLEQETLQIISKALEEGKWVSMITLSDEQRASIKHLELLTTKKILYALNKKSGGKNIDELQSGAADERYVKLLDFLKEQGASWVIVDAGSESDLKDMSVEDKSVFRAELGIESGIDDLIRKGYEILDLITFFTTGEKETRGWTIQRGSTAPLAGAAIHTDFKDRFIRAEVVFWEELIAAGSYAAAREKGLIRTEGKEYIVKDGDVIEFLV